MLCLGASRVRCWVFGEAGQPYATACGCHALITQRMQHSACMSGRGFVSVGVVQVTIILLGNWQLCRAVEPCVSRSTLKLQNPLLLTGLCPGPILHHHRHPQPSQNTAEANPAVGAQVGAAQAVVAATA